MSEALLAGAAALAAVYSTACLVYLDGPLQVFARLRAWAETYYPVNLGGLLSCPWCAGFWVSLWWASLLVLVLAWPAWTALFLAPGAAALCGLLLEVK